MYSYLSLSSVLTVQAYLGWGLITTATWTRELSEMRCRVRPLHLRVIGWRGTDDITCTSMPQSKKEQTRDEGLDG